MSTEDLLYSKTTVTNMFSDLPEPNASSILSLQDLNRVEVNQRLAPMIYLGTLMCFGIPGNLSVIIIYFRKFECSTNRTFILALAFIDTVACLVCMPFEITEMNFQYIFFSDLACKLFRLNNFVVSIASNLTLSGLSIDRFCRVCRPLKRQMSVFMARAFCTGVVIVSMIFASPTCVIYGVRHVKLPGNVTGYDCSTNDEFIDTKYPFIYNVFLFSIFFVNMLMFVVIYSSIAIHIKRHVKFRNEFQQRTITHAVLKKIQNKQNARERQHVSFNLRETNEKTEDRTRNSDNQTTIDSTNKITKIAFAVNLLYILSYAPYLVLNIWSTVKGGFVAPPGPVTSAILPIVTRSVFINNIANPYTYGVLDKRFRMHVKKAFV